MTGFLDDFNASTKSALYGLMDDAAWIKKSGGSANIKVEFSSEPLKDELNNIINIDNPMAICYSADVPGIIIADVLAVQDAQYTIIDVLTYGDGMVELGLRKL